MAHPIAGSAAALRPHLMTRREALIATGGLTWAVAFPRSGAAEAGLTDRTFAVHRQGQRIGTHRVRFAEADGGQRVTTEVELAVKIAFVTAFRYEQKAVESWQDGMLVAAEVRTNDDGDKTRVVCEQVDDELKVTGPKGDFTVDLGTMTDLSFWNIAITRQRQLIDVKDGDITKVRTTVDGVADTVEVGGEAIQAQRFEIVVSAKRSGRIWYDAQGAWVKAQLKTRGELLDYELIV